MPVSGLLLVVASGSVVVAGTGAGRISSWFSMVADVVVVGWLTAKEERKEKENEGRRKYIPHRRSNFGKSAFE